LVVSVRLATRKLGELLEGSGLSGSHRVAACDGWRGTWRFLPLCKKGVFGMQRNEVDLGL